MTLTYMQIDWVSHFTQSNRLILIILTGAHILWTPFMARTHLLQVTSPCICLSAYSSFLADNKKCKLCATSVFSFSFFFNLFFSTVQHGDQVTHTCIHNFSSHCCVAIIFCFCFILPVTFFPRYSGGSYTLTWKHIIATHLLVSSCVFSKTLYIQKTIKITTKKL